MFLRIIKRFWLAIAIVVVVIGGIFYYRARKNSNTAVSYQTAQVTKGTLTVSVSGTGNVVVDKKANVNPSISGEVKEVGVKVGDQVKQGQTLFRITNDQLDIAVNKANVTYLQAQQSLENAKSQLIDAQNARSALDEDDPNDKIAPASDAEKSAADQKVVAAELSVKSAEVNVDSANADYKLQRENAAKRIVKAPIDGTVTTLNVENGDQLGSGSSSSSSTSQSSSSSSSTSSGSSSSVPVVIEDLSSLKVSISLNEVDTNKVKADQKVSMTFDAIDGLTLTGKVEQISTAGTNTSGVVTYPATILFDSIDDRVKPQMSVTATITTDVKQDVLMVANTAVKTQNDTKYVQIMENGKPKQQVVKVGSSNDTSTEITEGLKEGDTVVTQTITAKTTATTSTRSSDRNNSMGIPGVGGGPPN